MRWIQAEPPSPRVAASGLVGFKRWARALRDPGDVPRTALLVGVPLVICLIVWACWPRPYYTGTDSIRTRDFVQQVRADRTLCVRGLQLPAQTGLVEFEIVTEGPGPPAMKLALRSREGTTIARSRLPDAAHAGARAKVAFAIPRRPDTPDSVPVSACVTPQRTIRFGGTLSVAGVAPTVDGRPVGQERIAVWFRPPAGSERSLLAQIPTIFHRASLFRPAWVGAWTYYVLLGLVLPLAFGLALGLLIRAQTLSWRRLGAGVFAVALAITLSWALLTPPFQAPDEQDHFAYVQQLAENGKAASQVPGTPPWSSSLVVALQSTWALAANEQADGRPPWLARDERAWAIKDSRDPSKKDGGGATTAATHGPVYYGAMTLAYRAAGDSSIWSELTAMRIMSGLLSALTVLFVLLAGREIAPSKPLFAVGAALLVALNPMFTFIGASVNNDVGVNAAAALLLFLIMRAARRDLTLPLALAIGGTLGVLPVIKGTSYALYVVAAIALLGLLLKVRSRKVLAGVATVALALVLVQIGWGSVAAQFGRTTFTTPGGGAPITGNSLWSTAGPSLSYLWQIFLPSLGFMYDHYPLHDWPAYTIYIVRGWASFGWYAIVFPPVVYAVILAGIGCTLLSAAVYVRRRFDWLKENWVIVVTLVAMPIVVVAAVERAFATNGQRALIAEMGRYLFPAVGALGLLAVGAYWAWGERWAARITTGVVVSAMVLTFASQLLTLRGFYT